MKTDSNRSYEWIAKLVTALFCRFVINTARRFPYPFAPELSRNLNVPLTWITSIIAVNQGMGFIGIFFGPFADRLGYGVMMLVGMAFLAAGMFIAGFFGVYTMVFVGLVISGLGKTLFDPSLQAYVGSRVPFEKRGLVVGLLELSWAASTLMGIPVVGYLMQQFGWRSPFLILFVMGLFGIFAMGLILYKEKGSRPPPPSTVGFRNLLKSITDNRSSMGIMGFAFFVSAANDHLFVVYGAWFEQSFQLNLVALGFSTVVIGTAELFGEFITAIFADRIGLKRSVLIGAVFSIVCYAMLPFLSKSLLSAFLGLFFVFLFFEFTIVSSLSLCTELLPGNRGTMMAGYFGAAGLGRVIGALMGGPVWGRFGISGVVAVSTSSSILATLFILWGLDNWEKSLS
ncbi:MAG: MFS transporter [Desulfobacterales bacterium]